MNETERNLSGNGTDQDSYIVEMRGIVKRFPGITANADVTIRIKKGEIYALLGENGAGKSTLMSMLFGMYEPDEGEIYVRGRKETINSPRVAAGLGIGMVHQHFRLVSDFTIAENIILGIEPQRKILGALPAVDLATANERIAALSKEYGLEVDPKAIVGETGVSVQQRVEILKMLYREAEILIFDEPTAVLTPQEIDALLEILRNLRRGGKTIILITHKLEEIRRVADRCAILRRGRLIGVRDVRETDVREMASLMVGREVLFNVVKTPMKPGKTVLEVRNLTVAGQGGVNVVQNVSFKVREGEIFSIAGVSGNGQGEIADAIAGLLKVKSGKILLEGEDITEASIRDRALKGMAYIPEDRHGVGLLLDFMLKDNLALRRYFQPPFAKKNVLAKDAFDEYGRRLIEEYDIRSAEGGTTIVRSMSGGNQQKAIVGREIEQDGRLLIFVQPTRGLDIGAIEKIHGQIVQERDKGKAILLISLELDEIMDLSDTIAVIYGGKLGRIAPADSYTTKEIGEYMMGVRRDEIPETGEDTGDEKK